jgi:hypothetical protein
MSQHLFRVHPVRSLIPVIVVSFLLSSCGSQVSRTTGSAGRSMFGVLRQPRTADDVLPKQLEDSLREGEGPEFSAQAIGAARRILPTTPAWLVPADNGELCIAMLEYPVASTGRTSSLPPIASHGCVGEPAALLGRLVVVRSLATAPTTRDAPAEIIGVSPDGVANVTVKANHSRLTTVGVSRNAYSATVTGPKQLLFRTKRRGQVSLIRVPLTTPSTSNESPNSAPATGSL